MSIIESELYCVYKDCFLPHFFLDVGFHKYFRRFYDEFLDYQTDTIGLTKSKLLLVDIKDLYSNFIKYIFFSIFSFFTKSSVLFFFKESDLFFKSNLLYTPFQPLINFFFYKKQFNFFFSFLDFTFLIQSLKLNLDYSKKKVKFITKEKKPSFLLYDRVDHLEPKVAKKRMSLNSLIRRCSTVSFKKVTTFSLESNKLILLDQAFLQNEFITTISSKLQFILLIYFNMNISQYELLCKSNKTVLTLLYVGTLLSRDSLILKPSKLKVLSFFEDIQNNLNSFKPQLLFFYWLFKRI